MKDILIIENNVVTGVKDIDIETIEIPEGVIRIGRFAFSNCKSLKSISIPNSVISIGYYAFFYTSLRSIDIPNSVKNKAKR